MKGINSSRHIIQHSGIAFGTSGARGLVKDFTPEVCAAFALSFLSVMKKNFTFDRIALAIDNRPSSYQMAQACAAALKSKGINCTYYGVIPTPALAYQSMSDKIPSIMVTGSHIPFDRNGLKFYRPDGEISKEDELKILGADVSSKDLQLDELVAEKNAAENYITRYTSLFQAPFLKGRRIGIYEHSSAGRDLYRPLFEALGAEVISLERSDKFVPIDTEAVSAEDREKALKWVKQFNLDAIFSTDGDGDRPLVSDEKGNWLRGDVLGLLCSLSLSADAVAIPVSCNSIISEGNFFKHVELTRIGSPYVIAAFPDLAEQYRNVVGFEANGGFLLGSDIEVNHQPLAALPTRDAVLPAIMLLYSAREGDISEQTKRLPARYTYSDRLVNVSTEISKKIVEMGINNQQSLLNYIGLGDLRPLHVNSTDGLRIKLVCGNIVHLRPSGNAPELRCYAEADSAEKAQEIVEISLNSIAKNIK